MQSWGPSINSFQALNMNLGYFVQHKSPLKKHHCIGIFLYHPQGQLQAQDGDVKWGAEARDPKLKFDGFTMI